MTLTVIPIQSVTDVITNSSSEVFVLDTDKTCEQVNEILEGITEGFDYPVIFHLEDYREWRKDTNKEEFGVSYSYPNEIFYIVRDWFVDPKNEEDMYLFKIDFLFMPWSKIIPGTDLIGYSSDTFLPLHEAFVEYINENWGIFKDYLFNVNYPLTKESYLDNKYEIKKIPGKYLKKFIDSYKEPVYGWELTERNNVETLDGKILVVSSGDNSIPFNTWNTIYNNFKGFNIHLG